MKIGMFTLLQIFYNNEPAIKLVIIQKS